MQSVHVLRSDLRSFLRDTRQRAAVIINEFVYDDNGTDDREFVELYNNGVAAVDISGWTVIGPRRPRQSTHRQRFPPPQVLPPGAYYVLSNTGVLNSNQTVAGRFSRERYREHRTSRSRAAR